MSPSNTSTYVIVAIALLSIAVVASYVPARRARNVNPIQALRSD